MLSIRGFKLELSPFVTNVPSFYGDTYFLLLKIAWSILVFVLLCVFFTFSLWHLVYTNP